MLKKLRDLFKKRNTMRATDETDFPHCEFDECADNELYLVFLRKDNMEKAITPPSLAWLGCPLTYADKGEIQKIEKVRVLKEYYPQESTSS